MLSLTQQYIYRVNLLKDTFHRDNYLATAAACKQTGFEDKRPAREDRRGQGAIREAR